VACRPFRSQLSAYLDGELQVPRRDAVRSHLEFCPGCRLELQRLERLAGYLREVQTPEVPEALTKRILTAASSTTFAPRRPWWAWVPSMPLVPARSPWLARAAVCFLFSLGAATGAFLGWGTSRSSRPPVSPSDGTSAESVYGLDVFDGTPPGSIEGAYAVLALPAEGTSR
jgi:anti-sigma factor RsiW